MPVVSMTGYGRGIAIYKGLRIDVEISSLNKKQFEARISLPDKLSKLEPMVSDMIQRHISRGYVNCNVSLTMSPKAYKRYLKWDIEKAHVYVDLLKNTARKLNIRDDISISTLIRIPDIMKNITTPDIDIKIESRPVKHAVSQALSELVKKRKNEGMIIEKELIDRLHVMLNLLKTIRKRIPHILAREQHAIINAIHKLGVLPPRTLDTAEQKNTYEMLLQKMLTYAGMNAPDEEVSRLEMHLNSALKMLDKNKPIGRDLDFVAQELNREINTLGAKLKDYRSSCLVIKFKSTLESFREQVQNIE